MKTKEEIYIKMKRGRQLYEYGGFGYVIKSKGTLVIEIPMGLEIHARNLLEDLKKC